jgi:hypothetical protein
MFAAMMIVGQYSRYWQHTMISDDDDDNDKALFAMVSVFATKMVSMFATMMIVGQYSRTVLAVFTTMMIRDDDDSRRCYDDYSSSGR